MGAVGKTNKRIQGPSLESSGTFVGFFYQTKEKRKLIYIFIIFLMLF